MSKSLHTQKYEGYWGLKNLCMPLLSALPLDMLWISFNKSFWSRCLWLIIILFFLPQNKWWIFHSELKQIKETSLTFVSAFLKFINFLNKVERSKEKNSNETESYFTVSSKWLMLSLNSLYMHVFFKFYDYIKVYTVLYYIHTCVLTFLPELAYIDYLPSLFKEGQAVFRGLDKQVGSR